MKRPRLFSRQALGGGSDASATRRAKAGNAYYGGPRSDHFDGRLFFNTEGKEPASFRDLLRWQFGGGKAKWPAEWPSPHPPAKPEPRLEPDALRVTMVGHASLLIQAGGLNFLTDPVWSPRASPFSFAGPRRVNAPGIAFDDLPPIDYVLLTHNHYDHMDAATHVEQVLVPTMRAAAERTVEATWKTAGSLLRRFPQHECRNYLVNAGYAST